VELSESQAAVKGIYVEKGNLRSAAAKADEESTSVKRRLPQIEADKKTAALAKVTFVYKYPSKCTSSADQCMYCHAKLQAGSAPFKTVGRHPF